MKIQIEDRRKKTTMLNYESLEENVGSMRIIFEYVTDSGALKRLQGMSLNPRELGINQVRILIEPEPQPQS